MQVCLLEHNGMHITYKPQSKYPTTFKKTNELMTFIYILNTFSNIHLLHYKSKFIIILPGLGFIRTVTPLYNYYGCSDTRSSRNPRHTHIQYYKSCLFYSNSLLRSFLNFFRPLSYCSLQPSIIWILAKT
jgi:hypothetical protein